MPSSSKSPYHDQRVAASHRSDVPPPVELTDADRAALLAIARAAVAASAGAVPRGNVDLARRALAHADLRGSAFVTLTENGDLRGCMGHLDPDLALDASVIEAASCAALLDPRFRRVTAKELAGIHIDVSVLGPIVPLREPLAFVIGHEGIVIACRGRRGLLLPEVGEQLRFERIAMLDTCCRKAGLPAGSWRDQTAVVSAFRTDRFGGNAIG